MVQNFENFINESYSQFSSKFKKLIEEILDNKETIEKNLYIHSNGNWYHDGIIDFPGDFSLGDIKLQGIDEVGENVWVNVMGRIFVMIKIEYFSDEIIKGINKQLESIVKYK